LGERLKVSPDAQKARLVTTINAAVEGISCTTNRPSLKRDYSP
jgi:hypothetical protein